MIIKVLCTDTYRQTRGCGGGSLGLKEKSNTGEQLQREISELKWRGWGQTPVIFTLAVTLQHLSQNLEQDMRDYCHRVIEGFICRAAHQANSC